MRRLRPRGLRQEPRHRGPPQRGPLPLHRLDQAGLPQRRRDPAGQRHHAPDQPGENVAGDPGARRRGLPRYLRGHRQPYPARRRPGRDRHRRRRPGSGKRDARPRLLDAPAGHRRRRAERPSPAGHHRHRRGAGPDRVPAQAEGGRRLPGVLRRRRLQPDPRRPRDHLQHGSGIRRHCGDVRHRPADHRLPAPHRPRRRAGRPGGGLCAHRRTLGRQPGRRRVRAGTEVRPVQRGAQHGRPVQSARQGRHQRTGGERHRRQPRAGPRRGSRGPDAGRRGDHRRDHQLHQHQQPAQRDRRRPAGAQRRPPRPGPQAMGEDLAGTRLQGGHRIPARSRPAAAPGSPRLRRGGLRLHVLQRHVRRPRPGDPAGDRRARPVRHRGALRQPQLRRAHPPLRQAGLPRLAAAGGGLRHRRDHPLRHRARRARRGGRQGDPPEGPLAE